MVVRVVKEGLAAAVASIQLIMVAYLPPKIMFYIEDIATKIESEKEPVHNFSGFTVNV